MRHLMPVVRPLTVISWRLFALTCLSTLSVLPPEAAFANDLPAASAPVVEEAPGASVEKASQKPSRIVPGAFFAQGDGKTHEIALTFDDGPGASTPEVLAILKRHGIKATFFVNGMHVNKHADLLRTIQAAGHEVGDHTQNHVNFYAYEKTNGQERTEKRISKEMDDSRKAIVKVLDTPPRLLRMPHGYHRKWLGKIAATYNYTLVNWTFGADWEAMPTETMAKKYEASVRPGAILLFHDGGTKKQKMLGFLERVIVSAKQRKFSFATVSELLDHKTLAAPK